MDHLMIMEEDGMFVERDVEAENIVLGAHENDEV